MVHTKHSVLFTKLYPSPAFKYNDCLYLKDGVKHLNVSFHYFSQLTELVNCFSPNSYTFVKLTIKCTQC